MGISEYKSNNVLRTDFTIGDFGGFGDDFGTTAQDWSAYDGFGFWFNGTASGKRRLTASQAASTRVRLSS